MAERKAAFIYSSELEKYKYPPDVPFNTVRAKRVLDIIKSKGLLEGDNRSVIPPEPADRLVLKKFHTARYLNCLHRAGQGRFNVEALNMGIGTQDCPVFKGMYEYAALAAGATLVGAEHILKGEIDIAFNPSGGFHHAGPEKAAGFCYINDMALGCITLAEQGMRILYLDVDVHHGDGVADFFYDRSDVMTISLHQNPRTLFPGTGFVDEIGKGQGEGYCVNIPLPIGTYDQIYMKAFDHLVLPLIEVYNPDVIVFELGTDGLAGDPLANLQLTNNVYADVINHIMNFDKPILATGGGGYHVGNTVRAWALAWSVFCGEDTGEDMNPAIGGVLLESTEWQGGFRDRRLPVSQSQRDAVIPAVDATIKKIKETIFPIHGI